MVFVKNGVILYLFSPHRLVASSDAQCAFLQAGSSTLYTCLDLPSFASVFWVKKCSVDRSGQDIGLSVLQNGNQRARGSSHPTDYLTNSSSVSTETSSPTKKLEEDKINREECNTRFKLGQRRSRSTLVDNQLILCGMPIHDDDVFYSLT